MKSLINIRWIAVLVLIAIGISAREFQSVHPNAITRFLPDITWAAMIFTFLSLFISSKGSTTRLVLAFVATYSIEATQLYQAAWINNIRITELGGLFLGHNFAWSDIACYSLGCPLGLALERIILNRFLS